MVLLLKRPKSRATIIAVAMLFSVYYFVSTRPVANILLGWLEEKVLPGDKQLRPDDVSVIVILASSATVGPSGRAELIGAGWRRLWRGVEIYNELDGKVPILFSGGTGEGNVQEPGQLALRYAVQFGVPRSNFWLETESRTTYESGFAVKKLLDQHFPENQNHRIVLVTSAWHMPRAVAVFNRLGVKARPAPCDYRSGARLFSLRSVIPTYESFSISSIALHEWLGLVVYRIRALW